MEKTLFQRWNAGESGFTNFGSFQTTILEAYRIAGADNQKILERAFPFWFQNEEERKAYAASLRLIKDDIRENLLCSAIEGGSNYWYYLPDVTMCDKYGEKGDPLVTKMFLAIMAGEKIPVTDIEEDDCESDGEHRLGYISLENMDKAEQLMILKYSTHFGDAITENDDASTGDVFLQLIVMGDIMYG